MTLLSIEHLDVDIDGRAILDNIHLAIERGEIVTIVGPNGSGKTTLLKAIIGSLTPAWGKLHRAPGLVMGYVPQRLHLDPTLPMTVTRFMGLPRRHAPERIEQALERAGAAGLGRLQMSSLSGGQFQRILLARALLESPDLLILDEATQGLDQRGVADFYRQLESVRRELDCGILMVSHELHVVMRASDRVVCLNKSICCEGTPQRVATSPAYQAMFGHDIQDAFALYRHDHAHRQETAELAS
ncbi:metal ABC transporter ATP-binding protein [Halomonas elongata]|uniref:ABC-type transport system ATP-binding protein (Probable substrate zinc) n=1 Tax=Halomonas elongata (strain ATCC 33173 / DSM 2581 / NBRC 15536 / NCIMB 2198 / 1H9) TaxID=768066 RepID=E1VA07_HALED|nr:metal ABC transporter ATP-binding protein [Halomonas elongata]WBF17632.1 metal ABC transporter ATP-binding protein [Halomonas elongata]WPU46471.1 metal ABC transporter ATP-binding protein [Halomonas elongata DSM 2581]CBV43895.1 ABC-type transport system ATP-binding protein (probable substrate zinc) [Halomonas elongata DSM 2581]